MNPETARQAIDILEKVLSGEIKSSTALELWPDIEKEPDELIASAWHELNHFDSDDDIRAKDSEYSSLQHETLMRYVLELRAKYGL